MARHLGPFRVGAAWAVLPLLAVALTGCDSAEENAVRDVAAAFHAALGKHHGPAACRLLAPSTRREIVQSAGKPCPQAILEEKLPAPAEDGSTIDVFDTAGEIRYDDETIFLDKFPDGWKVSSAGCTERDPRPYDCRLSGG